MFKHASTSHLLYNHIEAAGAFRGAFEENEGNFYKVNLYLSKHLC